MSEDTGEHLESDVVVSELFTALAVVFVALVVRDVLLAEGRLSPRRMTWLRLALIFAAVAIALQVLRTFWWS